MHVTGAETAIAASLVALAAVAQNIWSNVGRTRSEREDRIWQRRAEIYTDLLTWAIRQKQLSSVTVPPSEWIESHGPLPSDEELIALEARVVAFASERVNKKVDELQAVWDQLRLAWGELEILNALGTGLAVAPDNLSRRAAPFEVKITELSAVVAIWVDGLAKIVTEELQSLRKIRRLSVPSTGRHASR